MTVQDEASLGVAWTELYEVGEKLHDLFKTLMVGGFTEDQALKLIAHLLAQGGGGEPSIGGNKTTA